MTGGAPAPPGLGGVLRAAGGILRRHLRRFAVLALALEVAPVLLLHAITAPVRRAVTPPFDTAEAWVVALVVYAAYLGAYALVPCLSFACNVAVVLVGLEGDRAPGPPVAQGRGIVLRLVALALATWVAGAFLSAWLPQPWGSCAYAVLSCWTVVLPVYAAERTPLGRLVGRSRAVFARGGRTMAALLGGYCAGVVGLNAAYLHFGAAFGTGQAAAWAGLAATSAVSSAFAVAADMAVIALYRELRRVERATPPPEVVEAFE